MSVGLPGSGIGGVFYLLSALWMPVHGAHGSMRGKRFRVRVIAGQSIMAALILAALWGTGAVIDMLISAPNVAAAARNALGSGEGSPVPHIFRAASFLLTFGTLAGVLLLVQILRFVVPQREAPPAPAKPIDRKAA